MNKQTILEQLLTIGFDEVEIKIYLYLLENGPITPLKLSRQLNMDRSKIYRYVEKMAKKNLLEESNDSWGKRIQATKPDNIGLFLQRKEEVLIEQKKLLPTLIKELNSFPTAVKKEFEIKHYRGQEGLRQMLWNQLSAKKDIIAFSYKNKNDICGKAYAEKIRTEQAERQIMLYEIENETDQGNYWYTNVKAWPKYYRSRHISPKILTIKQYVAIFNNTVAIMNWIKKEEIGLEIVNSTYADMQRQLFWKFWETLKS